MPNISTDGVQEWSLTLYIDKTTQCGRGDFTLPIRRGEALVHILHATIKDKDQNGLVTFNAGTTAVLCIPANPTQSIELDCTIAESVVSCTLPAAVSQIASSTNLAYFKFVNESAHTIATTESFTIKILRGAGEVDELIDVNDFSPYFELNQATIAADAATTAATTAAELANTKAGEAGSAAIVAATATANATTAAQTATSAAATATSAANDAASKAHDCVVAAAYADAATTAALNATANTVNAINTADSATTSAISAANSAITAAGNATTAATNATNAATSATNAASDATTAATNATNAATSANTAANNINVVLAEDGTLTVTNAAGTATEYEGIKDAIADCEEATEGAQQVIDDLDSAIEDLGYAKIDGYYEDMTVGNAEQLLSTVYVEDQEAYNYRTTGGSADVGNREYDTIVGGTVVWNQLVQNGNFTDTNIWTIRNVTFTVNNNIGTLKKNAGVAFGTGYISQIINKIANHKYLSIVDYKADEYTTKIRVFDSSTNITPIDTNWHTITQIISSSETANKEMLFWNLSDNTNNDMVLQFRNIMYIDLTQMFGSTIADYIYSLEQANEGAGVAWFRKYFPNDYYQFDPGTLRSVNVSQHKTVGFNLFDRSKETVNKKFNSQGQLENNVTFSVSDYIPVIPDTVYYFKNVARNAVAYAIACYDTNKNFIKTMQVAGGSGNTASGIKQLEDNVYYIRICYESAQTEVCVNLHHTGQRDGEYEPYVSHTYPLDESLELRGIPQLNAANELVYDGDVYEHDGTVTRRYGVVDLGTLTYGYNSTYAAFSAYKGDIKPQGKCICAKYVNQNGPNASDMSCCLGFTGWFVNNIIIKDSNYTDAAIFKAAMDGVYLIYELATPTTAEADPYRELQICDDYGTEEYTDYAYTQGTRDVAIPCGHVTKYPANLRDKLQHLPSLAASNGQYVITQSNMQMALTADTSPGRLTALEAKIPNAPTTDGAYLLKATVANGTATYSWEVQS